MCKALLLHASGQKGVHSSTFCVSNWWLQALVVEHFSSFCKKSAVRALRGHRFGLQPLWRARCGGVGTFLLERTAPVEEGYSVEVPSRRGSSQWIIGYVDNRSGFGEEDDNNTGEVEERDGEEVLSVACSKG